jgi:hypothetical protein
MKKEEMAKERSLMNELKVMAGLYGSGCSGINLFLPSVLRRYGFHVLP